MDHRKIQSKAELKQELNASRQSISHRADSLLQEMNFVDKAKRSIEKYPLAWGAGAFVGGLILLRLLLPSKKAVIINKDSPPTPIVTQRQSRLSSLFSLGVGLIVPQIRDWANHAVKEQLNALKAKCFPPSDTQH